MFRSTALRCTVRLRFLAAAVVLPMLFLTACSGASGDTGDGGTPSSQASTPSETPTPTPTPTPSATYKPASAEGPAENVPLPVMPEEAKVQSKEGLEAFARYWYEAANYGYETGDVGLVQAISAPDCTTCSNYYQVVDQGFAGDDWIADAEIRVQGSHSNYVLTADNRYQVLVQLQQEDLSFYGPKGLLSTSEGGSSSIVQMIEATYGSGQWLAIDLVTIKQ